MAIRITPTSVFLEGIEKRIFSISYVCRYATFICPLLDLNKYVHEKELEQYEIDKRYGSIKPIAKSKK